jgi:hypothetical protein
VVRENTPITDSWLDHHQTSTSVGYGFLPHSESAEQKIVRLFARVDFANRIPIELLVGGVISVASVRLFPPIVLAVTGFALIVADDLNELVAFDNRTFATVERDFATVTAKDFG